MNPSQTTTNSYDQITDQYLQRNQDRSVMAESLDRFANYLTPGGIVLDVGCGPGFDAALLRDKNLQVTGIDRSLGMMTAGKNLFPGTYVQADMAHLPFKPIFDGLWVNASLLHIQRDQVPLVLQEFCQILKPSGILFISVQKGSDEKWITGPYTNTVKRWFTYWTYKTLEECLRQSGFKILDHQSSDIWLHIYSKKF
jgi:ubiquinone/menaquinone biosynthesis C-methylase UbiE